MEKISQEALNAAFQAGLDSPEGRADIQQTSLLYIKQRLREESFARKILHPEPVTKHDCQRAVDHDTLVKIVDIEPDSVAKAINFHAEPDGEYVRGKRFQIDFFDIETKMYEKSESELHAYEMPLIKILEENSIKDIHEVEDTTFIGYVDSVFTSNSKAVVETATNYQNGKLRAVYACAGSADPLLTDTPTGKFDKVAITSGMKAMNIGGTPDGGSTVLATAAAGSAVDVTSNATAGSPVEGSTARRLRGECVLVNEGVWQDWLAQDHTQLGNDLASKVIVDGYTYDTVLGRKLIVTTKSNIVGSDSFYIFAEQRYLGKFYTLGQTQFWIEKRAKMIKWMTWETIGIGFGNVRGMQKVYLDSVA